MLFLSRLREVRTMSDWRVWAMTGLSVFTVVSFDRGDCHAHHFEAEEALVHREIGA